MQSQNCLLLAGLDGHETHVGSAHGFANSFSIGRIVLVALLHTVSQTAAPSVLLYAQPLQLIRPEVSAAASVYVDQAWGKLAKKITICSRFNCFFRTGLPCSSTPCN